MYKTKKKSFAVLIALSVVAFACSFVAMAFNTTNRFSANADDVSWVVANAEGNQAVITSASDGYTKATGMANYGERIITTSAVSVDGITVYLKCDNYSGQAMGWGFVGEGGYAPIDASKFNTTMRNGGDYWFLYYQNNHIGHENNDDTHDVAFADSSLSATNYGIDGNRFYGFNKAGSDVGYAITFNKQGNVWKLTFSGLTSNYTGRTPNDTNVAYVSASYIPDSAYVSTWIMDGVAANFYIKVSTSGSSGGGGGEQGGSTAWGGNLNPTVGSNGLNVSGTYNYMVSNERFSGYNFEMSLTTNTATADWVMVGIEKNQAEFNSGVNASTAANHYGVYLMFNHYTGSEITVSVFTFRPGTTEMYQSASGDIHAPCTGNIKIRMYPDEYDKYINIDVNGKILTSNRLRKTLLSTLVGSDLKGYVLVQTCSSSTCSYTITTINNKLATANNITSPDASNIPSTSCTKTAQTGSCVIVNNTDPAPIDPNSGTGIKPAGYALESNGLSASISAAFGGVGILLVGAAISLLIRKKTNIE